MSRRKYRSSTLSTTLTSRDEEIQRRPKLEAQPLSRGEVMSQSATPALGLRASERNPNNFSGLLPYAAQYVGIYQPLLGWKGRTNTKWVMKDVAVFFEELTRVIAEDIRKT